MAKNGVLHNDIIVEFNDARHVNLTRVKDLSTEDRFLNASDIRHLLQSQRNVSQRTISRRLNEFGMKARSPAVKPHLSDLNKRNRLIWARNHLSWTLNKWKCVSFSDESCFELGRGRNRYVRRKIGERYIKACVQQKLNRSMGTIKVCGSFSWHGYTPLTRITGNLNAVRYINILQTNLIDNQYIRNNRRDFVFQSDNCPVHTSRKVKKFFDDNNISTLQWPAVSPDCNIIENVWGIIKSKICRINPAPQNVDELWEIIRRTWDSLMSQNIFRQGLIRSMPRRVYALYASGGTFTKY